MTLDVLKVLIPTVLSFFVGIGITPLVSHYLYAWKAWKKSSVAVTLDGHAATISQTLHRDEVKKTPRMGGIIVWASVLLTIGVVWASAELWPTDLTTKLNFLSRNQTWLPLFTLLVGSIVGLIDDIFVVSGRHGSRAGGLSVKARLATVVFLGAIGAWWFYDKLEVSTIHIPFGGEWELGLAFVALFIIVMLSLFSSGVIDGIDGLSGGVLAIIFSTYGAIAFFQHQIDLAAFCGVVAGGILAFLWFNIPPARFYMSETGMLGLTTTLTIVAFLTNRVLELPLIALPLTATSAGNVIQLLSKKFRGKKVFRVAPIHHHFEAIGWPATKVVMRYWIIGTMSAVIGLIIALID